MNLKVKSKLIFGQMSVFIFFPDQTVISWLSWGSDYFMMFVIVHCCKSLCWSVKDPGSVFCVGVVQTLRDFQYVDRDGRDQGANVREKARQLVCLLRDEERLRQERSQALKTKERMAGGGSGGGGGVYGGIPPSYHPGRRTSQPSMAVLYGEEFSRSRGSPSSFNCEYSGFSNSFVHWHVISYKVKMANLLANSC